MKNWALNQQEQLFMDVSNCINSGELKPIGIKKDSALKIITYNEFDGYDFIKVGLQPYDASQDKKFLFDNNTPPTIQKKGNKIELKSKYYNASVYFKESEWKRFIESNNRRNVFWHNYFKHNCFGNDSIESITEKLFRNLTVNLLMEINKGQDVYKDPNLNTKIDSTKDIPLRREIIQFIGTDPDDPTFGYDSVYTSDLMELLNQKQQEVELNIILTTQNLSTKIKSIGIKYNSAYIDYEALFIHKEEEKKLLRLLIYYKLIQ